MFGSVARGDSDPGDIDLLVDASPTTTLFDLGGMQFESQELLGVRVDVLTPPGLPVKFREQVLKEAKPL